MTVDCSVLVWKSWATTSSVTTTDTDRVWWRWQDSVTASTAAFLIPQAILWRSWTAATVTCSGVPTLEDRARHESSRRDREARAAAASARRRSAEERGGSLLRSLLTTRQWRRFEREGIIDIKVGPTRKRRWYQIARAGSTGRGTRLDREGQPLWSFCCHPISYLPGQEDPLPVHDHLITQLLHLRFHEEEFLRRANAHRHTGPALPASREERLGMLLGEGNR